MSFKMGLNKIFLVGILLCQQFSGLLGYATTGGVNLQDGATYDFIVVGGGTGGGTVAARLAENGKHSVLLIEAGGIPHADLEIPAISMQYTTDTVNTVKIYQTVRQENAGLANNGIVNFTRGHMLGGGSGINAMVNNRGSPEDYNNWARLTGDEGWNYSNMLKYFRKYENYTGDYPSNHRGFHGPITISRPRYAPGVDEWLLAGRELGHEIAEPNGPQIKSFTRIDFSKNRGRRVSSYKGYIEPLLRRSSSSSSPSFQSASAASSHPGNSPNLHILIKTEVRRIIFEGNRAVGVKFISNSTHVGYARVKKEIIVSAGAIDSAAILLKSGIGPKSVLDKANIPAIKYLPVGQGLMDHVTVTTTVVFGNRSVSFIPDRDLNPQSWKLFNAYGDGPYTNTLGLNGQAFLFSSTLPPHERALGWPDLHLLPQNTNAQGILGPGTEVSDLQDWEVPVQWATYVSRPKSRGTVTLNPRNIDDSPLIDFQYFSHPNDMRVMLDGIKTFLKVCEETSAFRRVGCRVPTDSLPACSHIKFRSEPYWECFVRQLSSTGIHASGTCRMGSGSKAVVDTKLRVIGIEGLRVIDASIMPAVTNANTMSPTYAIAEKGADMILKRWEEVAPGQGLDWDLHLH